MVCNCGHAGLSDDEEHGDGMHGNDAQQWEESHDQWEHWEESHDQLEESHAQWEESHDQWEESHEQWDGMQWEGSNEQWDGIQWEDSHDQWEAYDAQQWEESHAWPASQSSASTGAARERRELLKRSMASGRTNSHKQELQHAEKQLRKSEKRGSIINISRSSSSNSTSKR